MFAVNVVTPEAKSRSFNSDLLNIVTPQGNMGILSNHMPIVTMINISIMTNVIDGKRERYSISGGVLFFKNNEATLMADSIEYEGDIDVERAQRAKQRAEERLKSKDPNIDQKRAELALRKALNRLSVGQ